MSLVWRVVAGLCALQATACGTDPAPVAPPAHEEPAPPDWLDEAELDEDSLEDELLEEGESPTAARAATLLPIDRPSNPPWDASPEGFEPVVLPIGPDRCRGESIWVGVETVSPERVEEPVDGAAGPPLPPPGELPPGVAREVARRMRPQTAIGVLSAMTSSYNGPGGMPLFQWYLDRTDTLPTLIFDRRISRQRLRDALRGADTGVPVRIGGVDPSGGRTCAVIALEQPPSLDAQRENAQWAGRVTASGWFGVRGPAAERPAELRPPAAALPGEAEQGLHVIQIRAEAQASAAAVLHALATSRWSVNRYGWLSEAPAVPYCLPRVGPCGCAIGCARGLELEAAGRARIRVGDAPPRVARVAEYCFDEAGRGRPAEPARWRGTCLDAFVDLADCSGECEPLQPAECGRCEACDERCPPGPPPPG